MAYSSVGLSPDGGGSWHLSRALPRAMVSQLLMLGDKLNASQMQTWGLVNQVCAPGQALADALALADRINARAPNAMGSIKELVNAASQHDLFAQLPLEKQHFVNNLHHPNAGIGIQAFLNKETPHYKP
jgi:enoyl-CoA hydratase/carnithine racemase